MTISGKAFGNKAYDSRGNEIPASNLHPDNYARFAEYMFTIAKHFRDVEGLPVRAISPINEPQWGWGSGWISQEGSYYTPKEVGDILKAFVDKRAEMGLHDIEIHGPESGDISHRETKEYLKEMYGVHGLQEAIPTFAVHSYWNDNNTRAKKRFGEYMRKNYPDIKVAQTEWCHMENGRDEGMNSAVRMSRVISDDINYLYAVSWEFWIAVSPYIYNDSLVYINGRNRDSGGNRRFPVDYHYYFPKRYYAMAQYSRFIESGDVIIGSSLNWGGKSNNISALTVKKADGLIVIVLVNRGNRDVNVRIKGVEGGFTRYVTDNDYSMRRGRHSDKDSESKVFIGGKSVTTLVVRA